MKKIIIVVILSMAVFLWGCGKQDSANENSEEMKSNDWEQMIPASYYSDHPFDMADINNFKVIKDKMYYFRSSWNEEAERVEGGLYCKSDEQDMPERKILDFQENILIEYLADLDGNVYTLYMTEESGNTIPYLRKINDAGDEVFLFDAQGQFQKKGKAQWTNSSAYRFEEEGIVNAGTEGCYLYAALKDRVLFQKLDMDNGTLGKEEIIACENGQIPPIILNGYEKGILIEEDNTLWTYQPMTKEKVIFVDFLSEYVNIMGNYIEQIGIHDDGSMMIYLYDYQQYVSEQALIRYFPKNQVKPKQTIRVALNQADNERMLEWVKRFNRQSMEYKVILDPFSGEADQGYHMLDMYQDILGNHGADIIDITNFSADELVSKGMIENLEPYFANSTLIRKEDILPSVWKAGLSEGKMYSVIPAFTIQSLLVKEDGIDGSTWTVEEYITLADKNPQSNPYNGFRSFEIIYMLMTAGIDNFVNWELKKADFDQDAFIQILDFAKRIDHKTQSNVMDHPDRFQLLLNGKWVTSMCFINNMVDFMEMKEEIGENIVMASYPNESKIPWYPMTCLSTLSISSTSDNKEGAWAFLEYLLSDNIQKNVTNGIWPVSKAGFDHAIRTTQAVTFSGKQINITEEDVQLIYYMAENSYKNKQWEDSSIKTIILEEIISFLEDGKSSEETSKIIQNRVQLYFDE